MKTKIIGSIVIGLFALVYVSMIGLAKNYGWLEILFQSFLIIVASFNILWLLEKPQRFFSTAKSKDGEKK